MLRIIGHRCKRFGKLYVCLSSAGAQVSTVLAR